MYKIIHDKKVVDVVHTPIFLRILKNGNIATIFDKTSAQGILGSDYKTLYSFSASKIPDAIIAEIKEINLEEFNRLKNLLNLNQEITADENGLVRAKREKISDLSRMCKNNITKGFTITLSDGEEHEFRLTAEDQLNLLAIENQLHAGIKSFIFHSTDQPCRIYNEEDMIKIINAFRKYTLYHTTYFNTAKQYINSLTSEKEVRMFTYGTDVSDASNNIAIKQILRRGGNI